MVWIILLIYASSVVFKRWINKEFMKGTYLDPVPWTWFVPLMGSIYLLVEIASHISWEDTRLAKWLDGLEWWNNFIGNNWDNE